MGDIGKFILLALVLAALPVWALAAWNSIQLYRNVKKGMRLKMMFDPLWWLKSHAERYLEPEGMQYYYGAMKYGLIFFGFVLAGLILGFTIVELG